jgi:hypothetical protein
MLRTIGVVSAIALGVGLAWPAAAMDGRTGGGGAVHSANAGPGAGGGTIHSAGAGGGPMQGAGVGRGNVMAVRSDSPSGRLAERDMGRNNLGRMRMGEDHDRDHGRDRGHDRDHFRFFPSFAFGLDTYSDVYDPDYGGCWELHRVWSHGSWRLRRFWVCN